MAQLTVRDRMMTRALFLRASERAPGMPARPTDVDVNSLSRGGQGLGPGGPRLSNTVIAVFST